MTGRSTRNQCIWHTQLVGVLDEQCKGGHTNLREDGVGRALKRGEDSPDVSGGRALVDDGKAGGCGRGTGGRKGRCEEEEGGETKSEHFRLG